MSQSMRHVSVVHVAFPETSADFTAGNSTTRRSISLSYVNNPIDAQRAIRAKGEEVRSLELKGGEVMDEEESILESFRGEEETGEDSENGKNCASRVRILVVTGAFSSALWLAEKSPENQMGVGRS